MTSSTTGELTETDGEMRMEWKISNFFSLSGDIDEYYSSSEFCFSGATWYLKIYPNGQNKFNSNDYVGLYLVRRDCGPPVSVMYSLVLKTADGKNAKIFSDKDVFDKKYEGWGTSKFFCRSDLLKRKLELVPGDVLTINSFLKHDDPQILAISSFRRSHNVCSFLKKALTERKRTDVLLKVKHKEYPAHRMILESWSPVFDAMFGYDTEERRTGVVNISDITPDAFERVLSYMYSGEVEGLTLENAFDLYAAADKYDIKDLKELCKVFLESNFSVERICDIIRFADVYKEEEMERRARKYFKDNIKTVLETEHWKNFVEENHALSVDLLSYAVKEFC